MPIIYGFLERITYHNEENDFVVAKLQEKGKRELTTIVGNLKVINPGESLKLTGRWVHNKKFGEQFQVETYEVTVPATVHGIRKYLGSGLIKGIGPIMAERIVKEFALDTLEIIEKTPERLSEVDGIGLKRIAMITRAWEEQREIKEMMIFLQGHGVSATYSTKIYKQYGDRSIEVVKENPYRLAQEIITKAITGLSKGKEIILEEINVEKDHRAVYLAPFHVAETEIAKRLKKLKESPSTIRPIHPEKAIEWVQQKLNIERAEKQKEAVFLAGNSKVLIITGGPGTGKTTIITAILKIFQQLKLRILLAAPTGRAAKRMSEATGWAPKTIHRLLEYSPKKGGFKKDQDDPLEADVLIIDEASMVDTLLMYHLLKAIPSQPPLIFVGDVDQLPSVGAGNVLKGVIDSVAFTVVRLTEIFRQAQRSMIVVNAHRVNQGEFPILKGIEEKESSDFFFVEEEDPEKILNKILTLCSERIPNHFGFHPIRDIQVLTPMHKGVIGAINLNLELQKRLNPEQQGITHGSRTFKLNDKVMQIVNNYDKEVFNGDIGWISKIDQEDRELTIDFDGRLIPYDFSDLDEVVLAYAFSVHKSRGSEYPVVFLPVTTQHYMLLQRNLIYTGITREKKLVVLIGTKKALAIAIKNNKPQLRFTLLSERLKPLWSN